jgi:hypothetical protein
MSARVRETVWKALWLIAASLFFITLLALTTVSVEQGFIVVLKSLLLENSMTEIFWVGAAIASLIPVGFLTVYGCIFFVMCGERVWRFISR